MGIPERRTTDGFEMQLAVNHLGHFTLTALLLPALLGSGGARVVSVTSTGRHAGRALDPGNPHLAGELRCPGGPTGSRSWQVRFRVHAESRPANPNPHSLVG
jgi:NAD(P)-dependent dehydrogenase (short-subunit alcohol dehydrogenase family)